jgi:hypothetical protein
MSRADAEKTAREAWYVVADDGAALADGLLDVLKRLAEE